MLFTKAGVSALHTWTHQRLDTVFEHARVLTPSEFTQTIPGFGQASVRDQLAHILAAESGWIRRLQKPAFGNRELTVDSLPDLPSLVIAKGDVIWATRAYLESLDEIQLNTALESIPEDWVGPPRSPAFILQHICTHAFHHKGQIAAMCRILSHPLADTDLQR
jgi:uncharacterized damage-inducible protein DinB